MSLVAALLFGAAPLGFGLLRAWRAGNDLRMTWMALASTLFAASVLAAAVGRRRSRRAVFTQSVVIFLVSTALAGGTGFALGATEGPGVWAVAVVLSVCLAIASVFAEFARPGGG
jgi:hypothetical protein